MNVYRNTKLPPEQVIPYELARPEKYIVSAEPIFNNGSLIYYSHRLLGLLVDQERTTLVGGWDHDIWSMTQEKGEGGGRGAKAGFIHGGSAPAGGD